MRSAEDITPDVTELNVLVFKFCEVSNRKENTKNGNVIKKNNAQFHREQGSDVPHRRRCLRLPTGHASVRLINARVTRS